MFRNMVSARFLLLVTSLVGVAMFTAACGEDGGPAAPEVTPPPAARILVLEDGSTEDHVFMVLDEAGFDVMLGGNWWEYTAEDISDYDAVFLLNGYDYSHEMSQQAQDRLSAYVAGGGGLVGIDWLMYYRSSRNGTVCDILPVTSSRDYGYEPEMYTRVVDHPIASGLASTFMTGSEWTWVEYMPDPAPHKNAVTVFSGTYSGAAVVAGSYGQGRTIAWGSAGEYNGEEIWNPAIDRLLVNMASWLSGRS